MSVYHGQWISGVNAGGCGAPPKQGEEGSVVHLRTFSLVKASNQSLVYMKYEHLLYIQRGLIRLCWISFNRDSSEVCATDVFTSLRNDHR